jgi:hypothetical protein
MSLNSLKIATDGYLKKTTKVALIIAVAGYLNYGSIPPAPSIRNRQEIVQGGGEFDNLRRQVLEDDQEILLICKAFIHVID